MNRENMERWVEALESGDWEQITQRLSNYGNKVCAVGVAGKLAKVHPRRLWANATPAYDEISKWLDHPVINFRIPVPEDESRYGYYAGIEVTMLMANDFCGMSFWEIAQALRAKYLKDEG